MVSTSLCLQLDTSACWKFTLLYRIHISGLKGLSEREESPQLIQFKMSKIVFLILQAVLQLAGGTSLRVLKANVVALDVSDLSSSEVSLHCGEQYEGEQIHWEMNEKSISETGNRITVTIDGLRGGNFTCHRANHRDTLNYTLLLVHPVNFPKGVLTHSIHREFVSCFARNYNGQFHCSWTWHQERKERAVVYFAAIRNSSLINCTLDSDISGLTCIDEDYCPYSEEPRSINLTLFVRNLYRLEEHQRTFIIRDIVQPDKVNITKIQDDVFEWRPPGTWSFPCSFFPLSYEVKVVPNNHSCDSTGTRVEKMETTETHYKVNAKKTYTFCVRAQDTLTKTLWSDWSRHHVRKHRHTSEQ